VSFEIRLPSDIQAKVDEWQANIDERQALFMQAVQQLHVCNTRELPGMLENLATRAREFAVVRLTNQRAIYDMITIHGMPTIIASGTKADISKLDEMELVGAWQVPTAPYCLRCGARTFGEPDGFKPSIEAGFEHQDCLFPARGVRWALP